MIRTWKPYFISTLILAISCFQTMAQDAEQIEPINPAKNTASSTLVLGVTEVSLIKANDGVVNLQLNQREAGMSIETNKSDSTGRLLISCVISNDTRRQLSAQITSGNIPDGTQLQLVALPPNANFVGEYGTLSSPMPIGAVDVPIVTNIATCYSGTEPTDGYPLKFMYTLDNESSYGSIRAKPGEQVVVTFTLTAVQ